MSSTLQCNHKPASPKPKFVLRHFSAVAITPPKVESTSQTQFTESEAITVIGRDCPKPFLKFSEYDWPEEVKKVIQQSGFESPTTIQSQSFPVALEKRDLVGIAQTGSGKTMSFIMPAVVHLLASSNQNG